MKNTQRGLLSKLILTLVVSVFSFPPLVFFWTIGIWAWKVYIMDMPDNSEELTQSFLDWGSPPIVSLGEISDELAGTILLEWAIFLSALMVFAALLLIVVLHCRKKVRFAKSTNAHSDNDRADRQLIRHMSSPTQTNIQSKNSNTRNIRPEWKLAEDRVLDVLKNTKYLIGLGGVTIYREFTPDRNRNRGDFFLVTPYGLFMIEVKSWYGSTHVYSSDSSTPSLLKSSLLVEVGKGKSGSYGVRVFTIRDRKYRGSYDELTINAYRNPIAQVRGYCAETAKVFGNDFSVKSVVVFSSVDKAGHKVYVDDVPLDGYGALDLPWHKTWLAYDDSLSDLLEKLLEESHDFVDTEEVNEFIRISSHFRFADSHTLEESKHS